MVWGHRMEHGMMIGMMMQIKMKGIRARIVSFLLFDQVIIKHFRDWKEEQSLVSLQLELVGIASVICDICLFHFLALAVYAHSPTAYDALKSFKILQLP